MAVGDFWKKVIGTRLTEFRIKFAKLDSSGLSALRVLTLQDQDHTLVGRDTTDTLSNKSISGVIKFLTPSGDGGASGPGNNEFNCGYSSSAFGDLVYLDSSATWQKADANVSGKFAGLLAFALEVKSSGQALLVALPSSMIWGATPFPTFTAGDPIYISKTAGAVTQDVSGHTTTDDAVRVIGWAFHADKMYFFPSSDYFTHV